MIKNPTKIWNNLLKENQFTQGFTQAYGMSDSFFSEESPDIDYFNAANFLRELADGLEEEVKE